jgi:hypothetical protein
MAIQNYPRISDGKPKEIDLLDTTTLVPHTQKLAQEKLEEIILTAIKKANEKSGREILSIPENASEEEKQEIYRKAGKKLFAYFKRYYDDPASTAQQIYKKHYRTVGRDQFLNRLVQKRRMNSGWRYQFLVSDCAAQSGRFLNVSDIGMTEGDFNAVIAFLEKSRKPLTLYASVKNRANTLGGQDWPKAIRALETIAEQDKNRVGPYCCVFAIAIDRGTRYIKRKQKSKDPHSLNTEVWLSDFVWPFFTNYSYEEMMQIVLETLLEHQKLPESPLEEAEDVPEEVLRVFGDACRKAGLLDESGYFNDPNKLVSFFCN